MSNKPMNYPMHISAVIPMIDADGRLAEATVTLSQHDLPTKADMMRALALAMEDMPEGFRIATPTDLARARLGEAGLDAGALAGDLGPWRGYTEEELTALVAEREDARLAYEQEQSEADQNAIEAGMRADIEAAEEDNQIDRDAASDA